MRLLLGLPCHCASHPPPQLLQWLEAGAAVELLLGCPAAVTGTSAAEPKPMSFRPQECLYTLDNHQLQ